MMVVLLDVLTIVAVLVLYLVVLVMVDVFL